MTTELMAAVASPLQAHVREAMGHHRAFRVDRMLPADILEKLARLDQALERKPAP